MCLGTVDPTHLPTAKEQFEDDLKRLECQVKCSDCPKPCNEIIDSIPSNEDPMKIITESEAITNALKERQEDIDNGYDVDEWGTTHGNCQYCNKPVTYPSAWEQGGVVTIINHSREATKPLNFWCPRHFIRIRCKSNDPLKSSKNLLKLIPEVKK